MRRTLEYLRVRPLVCLAPFFALGTAFGDRCPVRWAAAASLAAVLALFMLRARPAPLLVAVAFFGAGTGLLRSSLVRVPDSIPEGPAEIDGRVVSPSQHLVARRTPLSDTGERHGGMERTNFVAETAKGRIRVECFGSMEPLFGGERIRAFGRISLPPPPSNPGQFDRRAWLARQGISGVLRTERVEILSGSSGILSWIHRARRRLRERLEGSMRSEAAALSSALLFGDRAGLDDGFALDLQRTGTAHFLAVSGFNVALVVTPLWALFVLAGLSARPRNALLLLAVWGYTLLTGLEVSVVRAAIMASLWLGAELVGRRRDSMVSLAAAAVVILAVDPAQIRDVGFQLSFMAVLGILALVPLFGRFLAAEQTRLRRFYGWVLVSLAAWLATAPIVQTNFHLLTPCILVTNLLFCPLILAMTASAAIALAVPPVGAAAGATYAALAWLARHITEVPGSYFFVPAVPPFFVVLYYAGFTAWAAWCRISPSAWKPLLAAILVAPLAAPAFLHRRPAGLHLTVFDVGRGCCTYVELPDGRNFLFDAGSLDFRDAGASVAAPALWSRGIFRVDALFLSHPDADHTNGARSLIDRFRIRRLVVGRPFRSFPVGAELLEWARNRGLEVLEVERSGAAVPIAPDLELLGPPIWEKFGRDVPTNETSLVLRVTHGGKRVLLTGDIEERGTEALLESTDVEADAWVVPHHGKFQKLHQALLERVRPTVSVVPGAESYASRRVLQTLREKSRLYVVGETGALELEMTANGIAVWPFLATAR